MSKNNTKQTEATTSKSKIDLGQFRADSIVAIVFKTMKAAGNKGVTRDELDKAAVKVFDKYIDKADNEAYAKKQVGRILKDKTRGADPSKVTLKGGRYSLTDKFSKLMAA